MDKEKKIIIELFIEAGFIFQKSPAIFQIMTSFGPFKTGDIRGLKFSAKDLTNLPQRQKRTPSPAQ